MRKNFRKIPKTIRVQLNHIESRYVVVACPKIFSVEKINSGILKHLGIFIVNNKLVLPNEPILPPEKVGKYSYKNIYGYEVVRRDLPKETLHRSVETPNWGDSYYGTHTVELPYEKYPRDYFSPEYIRIKIDSKKLTDNQYLLTFEIEQVLDKESVDFDKELLKCLNILQENIGICGVQKSGTSLEDYLQSVNVSWELLPPGTRDEAINHIFSNRKTPNDEQKKTAGERYDFFMKLNPQKLVVGFSGTQRYFGALIEDHLIVFENIEYGNAIYIMFDGWQDLSRRTRTELLSGRYGVNFERVLHITGWKQKVINIVESRRKNK